MNTMYVLCARTCIMNGQWLNRSTHPRFSPITLSLSLSLSLPPYLLISLWMVCLSYMKMNSGFVISCHGSNSAGTRTANWALVVSTILTTTCNLRK